MKKTILLSIVLLPLISFCQTVFWTETFNNNCTSGCLAGAYTGTNGSWTVSTSGANGTAPNQWFISCAENGNAVGTCGSACAGSGDATLHIGANPGSECTCLVCSDPAGDCGASYDADAPGACAGLCAGGGVITHTRATSPAISTAGKTGISIAFDYIQAGQTNQDYASVYYSVDNGVTWTAIASPLAKTVNTGCAGQGKWTTYTSATLPAAVENIANLQISFTWQNNADNVGTDPSVAINNLRIRYTTLAPVTLQSFSATKQANAVLVQWTTATEINSDRFEIQASNITSSRSTVNFHTIGSVAAAGNSTSLKTYSFVDNAPNKSGTFYYKLKEIDKDARYTYSDIAVVNFNSASAFNVIAVTPNPYTEHTTLQMYMIKKGLLLCRIFDASQRLVSSQQVNVAEGNFSMDVDKAGNLPSGVYFVHLIFNNEQVVTRVVKK